MAKERLVLTWESSDNNIRLVKKRVEFKGSKKHCGKEASRWMYQHGFADIGDFFDFAWLFDRAQYNVYEKAMKEKNRELEGIAKQAKAQTSI